MAPFRYDTFNPGPRYEDRYAGAIAGTLRDMGNLRAQTALNVANANAEATRASGQIWGQAIGQIGQAVGNIPVQMQQAQQDARRNKILDAQLADQERTRSTRDRVNALLSDREIYGDDGTINMQAITQRMSGALPEGASGPTQPVDAATLFDVVGPINQHLTAARTAKSAWETSKQEALAKMAHGVLQIGTKTGDFVGPGQIAIGSLVKSGLLSQEDGTRMLTGLVEQPAEVTAQQLQELATLGGVKPEAAELFEHDPTKDLYNKRTGGLISAGTPAVKPEANVNEAQLALIASRGGPQGDAAQRALTILQNNRLAAAAAGRTPREPKDLTDVTNINDTVAGMKAGTLPPLLPGRASKDYIALMAEAKRQGFDIAGAATDWMATQKHIQTMNGAQQLRLNQAVNALPEMLDKVDDLAQQWNAGGFAPLNKLNLAAAKSGAYGTKWATVANQLDAQIADVVADLGNVYMGGNSPTDHALSLAGKSLSADWSEPVLRKMVDLAKQNVQIRRNSINNTGVAGASAENPYYPTPEGLPRPAPPPPAPSVNPFRK